LKHNFPVGSSLLLSFSGNCFGRLPQKGKKVCEGEKEKIENDG
jgi:hypothetical protein